MATLLQRLRRGSGRAGLGSGRAGLGSGRLVTPSVREICLIGSTAPVGEPGERIERLGRGYSVIATQARAGGSAAYSHVEPAD